MHTLFLLRQKSCAHWVKKVCLKNQCVKKIMYFRCDAIYKSTFAISLSLISVMWLFTPQ